MITIGSSNSTPNPRARMFQRLTRPNSRSTPSVRSTQEFGNERLRAQASQSVALALSRAPHCPQSE
jgi:hypothetical protein